MSKHALRHALVALSILGTFGCNSAPPEPTPGPATVSKPDPSSAGAVTLGDLQMFDKGKGDFLPTALRVPSKLVTQTFGKGTVYKWAEAAAADKKTLVASYVPLRKPSKMFFAPEQVQPDGSSELTVPIDSQAETKIFVVPQGKPEVVAPLKLADFRLDIVQPTGVKLLASANDVHVLDHEGHADEAVPLVGSKFSSIKLDHPIIGMHKLKLQPTAGVSHFSAIVVAENGVQVDAVVDRHSVIAGEPVVVRAKVLPAAGQTFGSAIVKAKIASKTGAAFATITLHDDGLNGDAVAGDHEYSGEFVPDADDMNEVGFWTAVVEARGVTGEGAPFLRHVSSGVGVALPIAKLTGKVTERRGDVESTPCFQFVVGVEAAIASRYRVRAVVTTLSGEAVAETSTSTELTKGQNRVVLAVPLKMLEGKGTGFKLADLQLVSMDTEFPVARLADAYVTKSSFAKH